MDNTLNILVEVLKNSLIDNFTIKIIWDKFYTIESLFDQWDIVVREFDSEKEYNKLEWEVKNEDLDILYINSKELFTQVLDQTGFLLLEELNNNENIKKELEQKAYLIIDFFWIK